MSTISFGGVVSGLDTQQIVSELVLLRRRPIALLENQKTDLRQGLSILSDLEKNLKKLGDIAERLDTSREFVSKAATSANEALFLGTADSTAPLGSFSIQVQNLAQTHRTHTQAYADTTDSVGTGTFSITQGAVTTDVTLSAGADSLVDLKDAINASDAEVNATIMNDGSGYRLLLSSDDSGAAASFTVDASGLSGGTGPTFTVSSAGQDATVFIDGVQVTSASNTVQGALEGVTLELIGTGTAELSIDGDDAEIESTLQELVDAYNDVMQTVNDQSQKGATLNGNTLLRTIQSRLSGIMTSAVETGGDIRIAAEVGLSLDRSGLLSLDSDKLASALSTDPASVTALFVDDGGTEGIAAGIARTVDELTNVADGLFKIRTDGINEQIKSIDSRIEREERSVSLYEELLNRKFTAMEVAISRLQQQSGFFGF